MSEHVSGRVPPEHIGWRIVDAGTLVHRFGDECVVYSPASGNTHVVGLPHARTLEVIRNGAVTNADIIDLLRGVLDLPPEEPIRTPVNVMLTMLHSMELIEPASR